MGCAESKPATKKTTRTNKKPIKSVKTTNVPPEFTRDEVVEELKMQKHDEGGYFCEVKRSDESITAPDGRGERLLYTTILYSLTKDRPVGTFHLNKSDIIHYFHGGSTLTYHVIHPDGKYEIMNLGTDIKKGDQLQIIVKGGCYKATELQPGGEYGVVGEAVAPGWDPRDSHIITSDEMLEKFPQHEILISRFAKEQRNCTKKHKRSASQQSFSTPLQFFDTPQDFQYLIKALHLTKNADGTYSGDSFVSPMLLEGFPISVSRYCLLVNSTPSVSRNNSLGGEILYYHSGSKLSVSITASDGSKNTCILGPNITSGDKLQIIIPAGSKTTTTLVNGKYSLFGVARCGNLLPDQ